MSSPRTRDDMAMHATSLLHPQIAEAIAIMHAHKTGEYVLDGLEDEAQRIFAEYTAQFIADLTPPDWDTALRATLGLEHGIAEAALRLHAAQKEKEAHG